MNNNIKILIKELIKKILINNKIIKEYNEINKIKINSINNIKNIRLTKSYLLYNNINRIYKWSNNIILNNINIDRIVKLYINYILNTKINNINNKNNKDINIYSTIYSSEPIFLHTNDQLLIYIRILIPINNKNNKTIISKHYINQINKLIYKNIIINILNKIYNKKVNIILIAINNNAGGMNEFIIGNKSIYSPYNYNITVNKLNKYIISKSTINRNNYINKNYLYNIMYTHLIYNYINTICPLANNNKLNNLFPSINYSILPIINNRYITGYNLHYAGKLPKADSSARTLKRITTIGQIHKPNNGINTVSKTFYSYNNNGLASVKAQICHGPYNNTL